MKAALTFSLSLSFSLIPAVIFAVPVVDTSYPYTGPAVPIADWVDQTINGNGKGFNRLVEAPAVTPGHSNPTNNINVISLAYVPNGILVHFQTPFGIGGEPCVKWGTSKDDLGTTSNGYTHTYDRTPPCSSVIVTQCSQFFHEVSLTNLQPSTTYYYQIPGGNGTTPSTVMSFQTARAAGVSGSFVVALINDMGYTNAIGTHTQLLKAIDQGAAFAWHGGDISYADDWYVGVLPCQEGEVCYNGSESELPNTPPAPFPDQYDQPIPAGEIPDQGGPQGGDASTLYETNWDIWQQWMVNITTKIPYMVNPGNHEATCAEFDGPNNELTAYLVNDVVNGTAPNSTLSYYSCPESQRNFTAYQHRFRMPGSETGGVSNFWYSFDYGLAHFVSFDGETDYYQSPEYPFVADLTGNETHPTEEETYVTDSGPFGYIDGSYKYNENYEQYNWLKADLAAVDRSKTPWVFAMSHRPMYSSQVSSYQLHMRNAFEQLFLDNGVDAYFAGHIHWYERMLPMGRNGTIDYASVVDNHTYTTASGKSMVHIVNGQAGNIESHSTLGKDPVLNLTKVLNNNDYGYTKLTVVNETTVETAFIRGEDGSVGDYLTLVKGT